MIEVYECINCLDEMAGFQPDGAPVILGRLY